jgi:glyoxylase-like metal-dependent hydrolase (beta-lactamase superfamily II)
MLTKIQPAYRLCAIVLLWLATALAASAQYTVARQRPPKTLDDVPPSKELVRTGLYVISGGGCNSVLRLSGNGLILVDGKLPGNYDDLLFHVRRIAPQGVRALILTDYHQVHSGNDAKFIEDGTAIIAQNNVKLSLTANSPSDSKIVPPTVTYDREYQIKMGGIEAQLMHFGNAHTDGDTVVYFPNLKVVAVGDLFAKTPDPDFSAGGSLVGWGPVLAQVLKLDFDIVVPGTGSVVTRAELEAFKTKIDTLVSRATSLVKQGVPKDQLMAQLKTDDLGWHLNLTGDDLNHFYAELSPAK